MPDTFFTQTTCDRCPNDLKVRMMSWFNDDTICTDCHWKEEEIKDSLKALSLDPKDYEGCGTIPSFYRNHYSCSGCGKEWSDISDCKGDDECPGCGTPYTPYVSEKLENDLETTKTEVKTNG